MENLMGIFTNYFWDNVPPNDKEIDQLYIKFAEIFKGNECDEELYWYLKSIEIPTNQVCAKEIIIEGAWGCQECEMNSNCILCNECYEESKDKHKNHCVAFKPYVNGCCDCGNPDAWNPSGFCSKHQGRFSSEKDITNYIAQSFQQQTIVSIKAVLIEMINKHIIMINTNATHSIQSNSILNKFFTFLTRICEANQALLYIVSELLIENYPHPTTHQCFRFTTSSVEIVKSSEEQHQCCCSFIRILFHNFGHSPNHEKFLFLLLHNYKLKIFMALSIFTSYDILAKNNCDTIQGFSVQVVISEEVSDIILHSSDLMNHIADSAYEHVMDCFTTDNHFRRVKSFLFHFFCDIGYLLNQKTIKQFTKHLHFYKRIIDIISHVHNSVSVTRVDSFQHDAYVESDLNVEYCLLEIFSLMMTIFDYSNVQHTNILFDYFIEIFKQKKYKQLKPDEYSFHITLTRAFSIFLTQYVFATAMCSKTDLLTALNTILSQKDFNFECIIQEVFKFFGFIISVKLRYWPYYGETMQVFNIVYYNCLIFLSCDFSLIKLLCSLEKYSHMLSFDQIFSLTDVLGSSEKLKTLLIQSPDDIELVNLEWIKDSSKEILLGQQVINLFVSILRVDDSLIELLYLSYEKIIRYKIQCGIFAAFNSAEKQSINNIIRSKVSHIVMSNDNYCLYSTIENALSTMFQAFLTKDEIMTMINDLLDQNKSNLRKGVGLSLKPQYYSIIDLSFLLGAKKISAAERYIMEFKNKEINLIQTVGLPITNCARTLQKQFEAAFYSKSNTGWVLLFLSAQLTNNNWGNILRYYLFSTLKLVTIMVSIGKHGNQLINDSIQLLQDKKQQLIQYLDQPSVEIDQTQKGLCFYLKNEIIQFTHFDIHTPSSTQEIASQDRQKDKLKNKKAQLLSKYKKQFKDKTKQFQENVGDLLPPSNTIEGNFQESDCLCVICRMVIDKNSYYQQPYGRFGIIVKDYFIQNIQIQNIKRAFEADDDLSSGIQFSSFLESDPHFNRRKQMRILTCNHFVHFTCYDEFVIQSLKFNNRKSFQCPFCKIFSNTCIPMVCLNPTDTMMKGLSFKSFIEAFKQNKLSEVSFSIDSSSVVWQNPVHNFLEDILSIKSKDQILISDLNKDEDILIKSYDFLFNHFKYFFIYYENYSNDQIDLMNTIIASLRLLSNTDHINKGWFFNRFLKLFMEVTCTCSLKINTGTVAYLLMEALFLYMIIFDDKQEEDKDNMMYIFRMFLPYIFVEMFVAHNLTLSGYGVTVQHWADCLTNAELQKYIISDHAKNAFNYYMNKLIVCRRIINNTKTSNCNQSQTSLDPQSIYNLNFDDTNLCELKDKPLMSLLTTEYPPFWPKVINPSEAINSLLISMRDNCSEHPIVMTPSFYSINMKLTVRFVNLPSDFLEFSSLMNSISCSSCKKSSSYSMMCLICGIQTCSSKKCIAKQSLASPSTYYSFLYHSQMCGGGNGVFISSDNGEIIFLAKQITIKPKIFAYLNQFGEEPKGYKISQDYQLSQQELDKAMNMFTSYSYRESASSSFIGFLGIVPDSDN